MKPVYMPYNYLSEPQATAICDILGTVVLPSPFNSVRSHRIRQLAGEGKIEIHAHNAPDDDDLITAMHDFRQWADLHAGKRGGISEFLMKRRSLTPFFDDTSTAQIRAEIKRERGAIRPDHSAERLFGFRLFLALAQDFDEKSDEINQEFDAIQEIEREVLNDLKGEGHVPPEIRGSAGLMDSIDYMLPERMKNWAGLFLTNPVDSGIFVTSSRSVVDCLIDDIADRVHPVACDCDMAWIRSWCCVNGDDDLAAKLNDKMKMLVESPSPLDQLAKIEKIPSGADAHAIIPPRLSCWLVAGMPPHDLFSRFTEITPPYSDRFSGKIQNTVIALVQPERIQRPESP